MKHGKFLVLEGMSGTGKETQAKLLCSYLRNQGIISQIVYHPSPELKVVLSQWRKTRSIDHISEMYFLLADRYNRVTRDIVPALTRGEWVISLRSFVSAIVYQGVTTRDKKFIRREFQRFEPDPDCLFYFDITPDTAMKRILSRTASTGEPLGTYETPQYLNRIRRAYASVLMSFTHVTVDASNTIESVHAHIVKNLPRN